MKKALITGVCGQDGAYLAEHLLNLGYEVHGGRRRSSLDEGQRLRALSIENDLTLINVDLTDPYNVIDVIQTGQYDEVYNLAAQSFVGASWDFPVQTAQVDAMGPLYLLDAIKRMSPHSKFYQASTSEMFGLIQEPIQSEKTPFYPRSPYGVAKLFSHSMTVNYRESFGLHASSGILFNHESPLRGVEFITKKVSLQLAQVKLGLRETIQIGNMDAKRDWGYAKEYVQGMHLMLQQTNGDDYVLATGVTTTVRSFIEFVCQALDIEIEWAGSGLDENGRDKKTGKLIIEVSEQFYRPAEVDVLLGDPAKAKAHLNWSAKTDVVGLAEMMARYDYDALQSSRNYY
jgi:GDPmannose 4,6-dehydratase